MEGGRRRADGFIASVTVVGVRAAARLLRGVVLIGGGAAIEAGRQELTNILR